MGKRRLVAGLDIGMTKVLVLVGEIQGNGQVGIVGVGTSPSRGMRRGVVVDIESAVRSIQEAVEKAQRMCGHPLRSFYLSVSGEHINSYRNRGIVAVSGKDRGITQADVDRVLEAVRVINVPSDREIVHVLPHEFVVDGYEGVRDPVGLMGSRLEVEAQIVTGVTTALQNLFRSVERAGFDVEEVILASLAAAESVLMQDEKELGVALADIGGGTTDLVIYERGSMTHSATLPVGGEYITMDIAVLLRTSLAQAEVVKIDYGQAQSESVENGKMFPVPNVAGQGIQQVSAKDLAEIIEARLCEILATLGSALKDAHGGHRLPSGLVLTGGVAATKGLADLAMDELDLPVRIGKPDNLGSLQDMATLPSFATGVGLLLLAANAHQGRMRVHGDGGSYRGFPGRVREWFRELL